MRRERRSRPARWAGPLLASALAIAACTGDESTTGGSSPSTSDATVTTLDGGGSPSTTHEVIPVPSEIVDGFDDHTVSRVASVAEFHALARSGVSNQSVVKFAIPEMMSSDAVRWLDSNFYALHDEWYWFRLMNGRAVPGFGTTPFSGPAFETVDDIVAWATQFGQLPLDLRFIESRTYGERLYSDNFYAEGMPDGRRNFGLGSVIFLPNAADERDHWLMELQFSDTPTVEEVERYVEIIAATLPAEIGEALEWVIRSPAQELVAQELESTGSAVRVARWTELIAPGETAVYNAGLTAGRLLIVDGVNTRLSDATEFDIVLIDTPPDRLPPAAAMITSAPQTPLAHVNLLARNRGIPNASRSGVLDDASLQQAARVRAPAVVSATADGELTIVLISNDEYRRWRDLQRPAPIAVPTVDPGSMPYVVSLSELAADVSGESDVAELRPVIGGKSAGFLALLAAPGVTTPPDPAAITVRPYLEHLDGVVPVIEAMLADDDFDDDADVRLVFLDGPDDFAEGFPARAGLVDDLFARHPEGSPLGEVLRADGLQRHLRDRPIEPATLAAIVERLELAYGSYADTQGLRFRSSSSVEDIEGFTGAGLYDSNTGFLRPDPNDPDRDKTVEEAILETWASYWSFEAFEERRLERIDHLSGAMGVTVHARFDDPLEASNGVAVLTLLPDADPDRAVLDVNVQAGDLSVANPDGGELPEVVRVRQGDDGSLRIERLAASTVGDGATVLDDEQLAELFGQLEAVGELWRDRVNAGLPVEQHAEVVTLDFEFKYMRAGWPAIAGAASLPGRLVVKQARSLDPGLRGVSAAVRDLPIPRDVLARATSVRRTCDPARAVPVIEVLTDPTLPPDLGYSANPFLAEERVEEEDDGECVEETLLATPTRFLVELLEESSAAG